jgi:tetratricopeptide (TPR) repeat protein
MLSRSTQLEVLDRLDIEPFIDIFRRGKADLKKSAVKLLGNIRSQQAVETLSMALMDEDIEIRLFAAGVLGGMEDEYAVAIKNKKNRYEAAPGDKAAGLEFAKLCISYAESRLLDQVAMSYYYSEALRVLEELPEDADILYLKAYCQQALGNHTDARRLAERCLETNRDDPGYNQLLWNIFFSERDYDALINAISDARKRGVSGLDEEVISFWS